MDVPPSSTFAMIFLKGGCSPSSSNTSNVHKYILTTVTFSMHHCSSTTFFRRRRSRAWAASLGVTPSLRVSDQPWRQFQSPPYFFFTGFMVPPSNPEDACRMRCSARPRL